MKKILVLCIATIMLIGLTACNQTEKPHPYETNISMAEMQTYVGGNDNFRITLTSGISEKNPKLDGLVGVTEEYTKLVVVPLNLAIMNKNFTFTVTGEKSTAAGSLAKDIFGGGYVASVKNISEVGAIKSVTVTSGTELNETVNITERTSNVINYKKALEIACNEFKTQIDAEKIDGVLQREIVIKFINDSKDAESTYYWYVSFIKGDNNYWCLLIDPTTSAVLTKKI